MLSIVKMDFDSDVEILDGEVIKSETIEIEDTTTSDEQVSLENDLHDLELVPIVYTTKLDDMGVLNFDPEFVNPDEATARILRESKPILSTYPGPPKKGRKNTRKFGRVKAILEKIYCSTQRLIKTEETCENVIKTEQIDDPDTCPIQIDLNSVKSEVLINKPIVEKTKCTSKDPCKYSELLKLCKPCSVVLLGPVLIGQYGSNQVIHGGQLLKANKVQKPRVLSLSDDEAPLITLYPPDSLVEDKSGTVSKPTSSEVHVGQKSSTFTKHDLLVERKSVTAKKDTRVKQYKGRKLAPKSIAPKTIQVDYLGESAKNVVNATQIPARLMRNSLLEIHDIFSNEYHMYYADNECNLLYYFKDTRDNAHLYKSIYLCADSRYKMDNCCWVKKDECIQALYPKAIIYPNSRFMRKPHPCKPGACTCCCRKKENVKQPDSVFTEKNYLASGSNNQMSLENDDIVMLDVEDKIDKTIISINQSHKVINQPSINQSHKVIPNEKNPNSLIKKALTYKGSLPAREGDNRRLVTLKTTDRENTAIVLRNYAEDVIEIYEKDKEGDIVSCFKTTCYGNTDQSNVIKILNKPNSVNETVCCWFKREYVITKLENSISLQPRAAKFIRSNHTCQSNECTCCCKPVKDEIKLKKIKLPPRSSRSQHWVSTLEAWGLASDSALNSQLASSVPLENDNDDDCQITSVMIGPIFSAQKSMVPPSAFVPEAVDGDELSKEVNSLITSILDRFKDVRLTINSDGKVAAALNTPVNTLSTVELKVLANILSYAQSQIDLLGVKVNSGMSLSNIINLKVDHVQANRAPLDPKIVYKEFGKNDNLHTNVQKVPVQSIDVNNTSMAAQAPAVPQTYTFFTNSTSVKNQHFNEAFSSYISSKMDTNITNSDTITPVIQNVYSLKDSETTQTTGGTDEDSSITAVWYRKPAQSSESEESGKQNISEKRNNSMTEDIQSNKIRILSPTKLGAAAVKSGGTATSAPMSNLSTAPVKGAMPQIIILPNNNFDGRMANPPPATNRHPVLIINPLHNSGGLLSAPIDNDTPDMAGIPGSGSIVTPQIIPTALPTSMHADVTVISDQDPFPDNDSNIDDSPEMDGASEMDNDPNMDICENYDIEMKYSPENNEEEEEDCILGF